MLRSLKRVLTLGIGDVGGLWKGSVVISTKLRVVVRSRWLFTGKETTCRRMSCSNGLGFGSFDR